LVIILAIVLIVVGPGKLPETGAALGRALRGFKDAVEGEARPDATSAHAGQLTQPGAPIQPSQAFPPQYVAMAQAPQPALTPQQPVQFTPQYVAMAQAPQPALTPQQPVQFPPQYVAMAQAPQPALTPQQPVQFPPFYPTISQPRLAPAELDRAATPQTTPAEEAANQG
jgi:TatA/E family protein of Tat protein translocase